MAKILSKFFKKPAKKNRKKSKRVKFHKSFKRSYREDYMREIETPGILQHMFTTFKLIFKNWKLFVPLIIFIILCNVFFIGLMSDSTYLSYEENLSSRFGGIDVNNIGNTAKAVLMFLSTFSTGGIIGVSNEATITLAFIFFVVIWLNTIFILRHYFAGKKIKFRDSLYNSATPFISTLAIIGIILIQCIPIVLLIIATSAAVKTEFLATPFYALLFFVFALVMIIISGYFLSSSIIALIAISAPGLYPMKAMHTASDLMMCRRVKFILRVVSLLFLAAIAWGIIMIPLIMLDMWLKSVWGWLEGFPFIPLCLQILTVFSAIYLSAYLYIYYRWMLNYEEK